MVSVAASANLPLIPTTFHLCSPGRFFAVNEIKALLAHVLMTYDVKLKDTDEFPPEMYFAGLVSANTKAKVLFRKRKI